MDSDLTPDLTDLERELCRLPEVNAVATVVLVISLPMIATAAYLMRDEGAGSRIVAE